MTDERSSSFETTPERRPAVLRRLETFGFTPETGDRPSRCRAIIFNPDGTKIIAIVRRRPGHDAYAVYPGGGVEEEDETALAAVWRELSEELDLTAEDVTLTGWVIRSDDQIGGDQFYYVGVAADEFEGLMIHGPEAGRDPAVAGTYEPRWISVAELDEANLQPPEITRIIQASL